MSERSECRFILQIASGKISFNVIYSRKQWIRMNFIGDE